MFAKRMLMVKLLGAIALTVNLSGAKLSAAPLITGVLNTQNVTDYSATGLNLGTAGYWFPNFAASSPASLVPVNQNSASNLPSWIQVDFNPSSPTYSFANGSPSSAYSTGGINTYNTLKLPNGTSGLSGQLVDDINAAANQTQSSTIITGWQFGPGAPSSAYISIVLDNAPLSELTTVQRLRVSNISADGKATPNATYDNLNAISNGVADVYTFRLDNIEVGGKFSVQLRTSGAAAGRDTALGGILFAPVPEPASIVTFAIGAVALAAWGWKRQRNGLSHSGRPASRV